MQNEEKSQKTRSSKFMEADMAVDLVLKIDDLVRAKCRIKTLIGDDDSSSISIYLLYLLSQL